MGSLQAITEAVLRAYRGRWVRGDGERERRREERENLVGELVEGVENGEGDGVEKERKVKILREVFGESERVDGRGTVGERKVPDWCVDDISFNPMVDPVMVSFAFLFPFPAPSHLLPLSFSSPSFSPSFSPFHSLLPLPPPPPPSVPSISPPPPHHPPPHHPTNTPPPQTKTGNSYERASLLKHLERSPTDPLTREPLTIHDLRPNLALKAACRAFLLENGWAVDE